MKTKSRHILLVESQGTLDGPSRRTTKSTVFTTRYGDVMQDQAAYAKIKKDADFAAQHGPVKVLWKDGKPVDNP